MGQQTTATTRDRPGLLGGGNYTAVSRSALQAEVASTRTLGTDRYGASTGMAAGHRAQGLAVGELKVPDDQDGCLVVGGVDSGRAPWPQRPDVGRMIGRGGGWRDVRVDRRAGQAGFLAAADLEAQGQGGSQVLTGAGGAVRGVAEPATG